MHVYSNITRLRTDGFTSVKPNTCAQRCPVRPRVGTNGLLRCEGRRKRVCRTSEGGEKRIPLRVHLLPVVVLDGGANEPPVSGQDVRVVVPQLLKKTRGPLDVGEQEGDRPGRQAFH